MFIIDNPSRSVYVTKEHFVESLAEYTNDVEQSWVDFLEEYPKQIVTVQNVLDGDFGGALLGKFNLIADDGDHLVIYVDGYQYAAWNKELESLITCSKIDFEARVKREDLEEVVSLLLALEKLTHGW